ncbi:probable NADH dehydrogenase [ubiquinone] 1 beta subcomplex subunit [Coccomyxa sp. Obi]|nr:probable NADH dehydrogenase [ubiquinone] 1 beta subcomplex subunit [Coccomyxa sp. Obi]
MAGRLANMRFLAQRVMAPKAVLPVRGEGGGPVAMGRAINEPLPEHDELLWDDGSAQPEHCLDQFPLVGKYEALGFLVGGLGFFGLLGVLANVNDKASKKPYVNREYPFDNLKAEMGGPFGPQRWVQGGQSEEAPAEESADEE